MKVELGRLRVSCGQRGISRGSELQSSGGLPTGHKLEQDQRIGESVDSAAYRLQLGCRSNLLDTRVANDYEWVFM